MRITYRRNSNFNYWEKRWERIPVDDFLVETNKYPIRYSEMIVQVKNSKILEAGCGAGRVFCHYFRLGHDVYGIDFTNIPINKLKMQNKDYKVQLGDIRKLEFNDNFFDVVLAFGLYHNILDGLDDAVIETLRVLKRGGKVCASFRADNIQTRIADFIEDLKTFSFKPKKYFHKISITSDEFKNLFESNGFVVNQIMPVENMPFLYKFRIFRHSSHKYFNESKARSEGYILSKIGSTLQAFLMKYFPGQFCNLYVLIAEKP